jgi:DNA-binding NarL/FixJ family response regulator
VINVLKIFVFGPIESPWTFTPVDQSFLDSISGLGSVTSTTDLSGKANLHDVEADVYIIDMSGNFLDARVFCQRLAHVKPTANLLLRTDKKSVRKFRGQLSRIKYRGLVRIDCPPSILKDAILSVAAGLDFCDPVIAEAFMPLS